MKLNFKDDTLPKYSFKDLEYGLNILLQKRDIIKEQLYCYIKEEVCIESGYNKTIYTSDLRKRYFDEIKVLESKAALVEDELANRMLTGNDDGMFEETVLGG